MGFPRAGSNPAGCERFFYAYFTSISNMYKISLSGVGFEPTQSYDYESLNLTP